VNSTLTDARVVGSNADAFKPVGATGTIGGPVRVHAIREVTLARSITRCQQYRCQQYMWYLTGRGGYGMVGDDRDRGLVSVGRGSAHGRLQDGHTGGQHGQGVLFIAAHSLICQKSPDFLPNVLCESIDDRFAILRAIR
jgi:hypothetical protein